MLRYIPFLKVSFSLSLLRHQMAAEGLLYKRERCRPDDIESFMTLGHHYNKIFLLLNFIIDGNEGELSTPSSSDGRASFHPKRQRRITGELDR